MSVLSPLDPLFPHTLKKVILALKITILSHFEAQYVPAFDAKRLHFPSRFRIVTFLRIYILQFCVNSSGGGGKLLLSKGLSPYKKGTKKKGRRIVEKVTCEFLTPFCAK